jgi:hypothetical protein
MKGTEAHPQVPNAPPGIDGHIYFKPDGKTTEKAVVSVKVSRRPNGKIRRSKANFFSIP